MTSKCANSCQVRELGARRENRSGCLLETRCAEKELQRTEGGAGSSLMCFRDSRKAAGLHSDVQEEGHGEAGEVTGVRPCFVGHGEKFGFHSKSIEKPLKALKQVIQSDFYFQMITLVAA